MFREGKKSQFILVEAGDISLNRKDMERVERVLEKISPFAEDYLETWDIDEWISILQGFITRGNRDVREAIALNQTLPECIYIDLYNYILSQDEDAFNARETASDYENFSISAGPYLHLLSNPSTPSSILEEEFRISVKFMLEVRTRFASVAQETILGNPSTPVEILRSMKDIIQAKRYMEGYSQGAIERLAGNPSTPPDLLRWLFLGRNFVQVLANPSYPFKKDHEVTVDSSDSVEKLVSLASNPSTPESILEQLVHKDYRDNLPEEKYVLMISRLAANPSTSEKVLQATREMIPEITKIRPGGRFGVRVFEALASNPSLPESLIREFATVGKEYGMLQIAANPATPEDVLVFWVGQSLAVLGNRLHEAWLNFLAAFIRNPKVPRDKIIQTYELLKTYYTRLVNEEISLPASEIRALGAVLENMAMNPTTPEHILIDMVSMVNHGTMDGSIHPSMDDLALLLYVNLLSSPYMPFHVLKESSRNNHPEIMAALASNTRLKVNR